ncbi:MAG: mechanosensitive ion channel [bacterium]|nr:mechanosensitive ion channel [bacterium]
MNIDNILNTMGEILPVYGLKILGAIVVLIVGRIIAGLVRTLIRKINTRTGVDSTVGNFLENLGYYLVMTFTILGAMGNFGVQTASIVAVLGATGFAIGFAMQGSLANFAAGVMLLVFRPYRLGDFVEAGGATGTVKNMTLFTTVINTPDNIRIIVPNGKIFGDTIKNISAESTRRVDMVVGIGYGSSIPAAKEIISRLLISDSRVLKDPAPQIEVAELADCSVNLVVRPWVNKEDYWAVKFSFTQKVKEALDHAGIEIPFPQTVVHQATAKSAEG